METHEILEKVRTGEMSVEEAEGYFRRKPFVDMGYARLDTHREIRSGFPEVVFCSGKADEHLLDIYETLYKENGEVFGTRASKAQYALVRERIPKITYDSVSHILKAEKKGKQREGKIAVCTAGTADMTWESAGFTACLPAWRRYRVRTVSLPRRGWKVRWQAS